MHYVIWTASAAGWVLALALLRSSKPGMDWAYAGLFLLMTVFLALRRDFPRRERALAMSWIGVMLLAASENLANAQLLANIGSHEVFVLALIKRSAALGWLEALAMIWLWRGYGLLVFLGPVSSLMGPDRRSAFYALAQEYPWRWWWLMPFVPLVLAFARISFLIWLDSI